MNAVWGLRCLKRKEKIGRLLLAIIFCSTVTIFYISEDMLTLLTTGWVSILCLTNAFLWVEHIGKQIVEKQEEAERKAQSLFQSNSVWALWARNWGSTVNITSKNLHKN